jgi:hypothetical protein
MKIESIPFDLSLVKGSIPASGDSERSSGLHVSDIISSLAEQIDPLPPALLEAYGALGFVVEQVFEAGIARACLSDRYIRIGELELDGIAGSPDIIDAESWSIVDTKCKWCSSKWAGVDGATQMEVQEAVESKFKKEIYQLKSYCHMVTECTDRPCNVGELWFCFVNGDYKEIAKGVRSPPHWVARRFTFTAAELLDNWNMLVNHAKEQRWLL